MKVSVLLLAFNEVRNLPGCLGALDWCDDIVVIDSGSTDGSIELAMTMGARVVERAFDDFASQRNFGLDAAALKHEWVLHLDADEIVPKEFALALEALEPTPGIDGYYVPSKLMLHDRWLQHAGMYPTYQVRLGHRERLRFKQVGHGQREDLPPERVATFSEPYLHYNFSHGISAWLRKHVKYAEDEARLLLETRQEIAPTSRSSHGVARRRTLKDLSRHVPLLLRPFARASYMMVVRRAFLDGRPGLLYVLLLSIYEAMIAAQAYDRRAMQVEHRDMKQKAGATQSQ